MRFGGTVMEAVTLTSAFTLVRSASFGMEVLRLKASSYGPRSTLNVSPLNVSVLISLT